MQHLRSDFCKETLEPAIDFSETISKNGYTEWSLKESNKKEIEMKIEGRMNYLSWVHFTLDDVEDGDVAVVGVQATGDGRREHHVFWL